MIEKKLDSLSKSKFRSSFHLNKKMKEYVIEKGMDILRSHAHDFVLSHLAPTYPNNDGKQTPMKQVHPVFIAMHACACCCRGCLEKWHGIEKGRELTQKEIDYVVDILMTWINSQLN